MNKPLLAAFWQPRYWPTWIGLGVLRGLSLLPLPVLHLLGAGLGELMFRLHGSRRRIALRNIERCFPELDSSGHLNLTRRHFRELAQSSISIGINWWASSNRLERLVNCRDRHYFNTAIADKKNIILLAPHFVALEIGGFYLSREIPMITMYQKTKNKLLNAIIIRSRSRFGGVLFERKTDMRSLIRETRSGKPFYYLPDQDPGRKGGGVFVPFFGIPTSTFPMLSRFAKMSNAIVLPCFSRQLPRGKGYEIIFLPPLDNFPSADIIEDTRRMNEVIEQSVRIMPEQYFWVHKRFKTRPPGEEDFYS